MIISQALYSCIKKGEEKNIPTNDTKAEIYKDLFRIGLMIQKDGTNKIFIAFRKEIKKRSNTYSGSSFGDIEKLHIYEIFIAFAKC